MTVRGRDVIILFILSVLAFLLLSCTIWWPRKNYIRQLPGGYVLSWVNSSDISIYVEGGIEHPTHMTGGIVIGNEVAAIRHDERYIYGYVSPAPNKYRANIEMVGYFVIDSAVGSLKSSLKYQAWKLELISLGITDHRVYDPWWLQ